VRACSLVCTELRAAAFDEHLWHQLCVAREVSFGMTPSAASAWCQETRASTRAPSFFALYALLEATGIAAGEGHWRSRDRQPCGAMLETAWSATGVLCGTLVRRATAVEDRWLGLRADSAFAVRPVFEQPPSAPSSPAVRVRLVPCIADADAGGYCQASSGVDVPLIDFCARGHLLDVAVTGGEEALPILHGLARSATRERFQRLYGSGLVPARELARPSEMTARAGCFGGLYVARYGSHGLELVQVSLLEEGEPDTDELDPIGTASSRSASYCRAVDELLPKRLVVRKVIGDMNVPAGFVTFYASLTSLAHGPDGGANNSEPLGPCPISPLHLAHLQTSGAPPQVLASVFAGEMQLNREPFDWRPEWDSLLLFAFAPSPGSAHDRMTSFAALWRATSFLLTFSAFDIRRHAWRATDSPRTRRAVVQRVAESVGGYTFVGAWGDDDDDDAADANEQHLDSADDASD
jgi:hypothetical protein